MAVWAETDLPAFLFGLAVVESIRVDCTHRDGHECHNKSLVLLSPSQPSQIKSSGAGAAA